MSDAVKTGLVWVLGFFGGGAFLAVLGMALQWWISVEVEKQLQANGVVPASAFIAVKNDVEDNAEAIDGIKDRWNNLVDAIAAQRIDDDG